MTSIPTAIIPAIQTSPVNNSKRNILEGLPAIVQFGLVAVAYFGVAKLGLSFSENNEIVSAVWPPSGVGLAAVFMLGYRVLPAITVAAVASNVTGDSSLGVAAGIAVGNTISIGLGAWLLDRVGFRPDLRDVRDVIALALLGAAVAPALNATIGNATLWIAGVVDSSDLWSVWRVWWLGDLTGVLLCAPPVLLLLNGRSGRQFELKRVAEASAGLALLAAVTILLLRESVTLAYPVFPLLVLIAMRYRQPGAVIAAPIVAIACIYFTGQGEGPFVGGTPADELLRAQVFVALAALTALMVAAARTEWERSENALKDLGESREALAEAQELAHIGSWEWEMTTDRVTWTEELHRIFGIEMVRPDTTFESYLEFIHPADRTYVNETIEGAIRGDRSFHMEHRIVRPDGEERHLDCHGRFTHDDDDRQLKMIGTAQDVTDQRLAEAQLNFLAMHDPLTGLGNRALFLEELEKALSRVGENRRLAVLFCDLDDFKSVNDSLGHETGDKLLAALPPRLERAVRPGNVIARFGGDEFVVLAERLDDETEANRIAERLSKAFSRPVEADGRTHHVSASIGIVFARPGEATAGEVLRDADAAMYRAKSVGRGEVSVFDEQLHTELIRRVGIEGDLRQAIVRGQLELAYQPVYAIADRELIGAEALVRWRHPERGLLLPDQFIDVAERVGTIGELGLWVLGQACRNAVEWQASSGMPDLTISINLSATQVSDPNLAVEIENALDSTGLPASRLALEITESVLLSQGPAPMKNLKRLRQLGARIVLDDFGTGYSSLSYLKRVPFDVLKIDREFITDLGRRPKDDSIVEAILSISESLGVAVVAEGVETSTQLEWLRTRGCRYAQGFFLNEPMTLEDLIDVTMTGAPERPGT
jgi:diguanylate cyclase (GGDEF)-like protein/PAS domain S-box-containing protein